MKFVVNQLRNEGWASTGSVVEIATIAQLTDELTPLLANSARGGVRHLLDVESVRSLARSASVRGVAESVLGAGAFAVRAILFDKTRDANWKVIWHQDLTIAVKARIETDGFGPWTEKDGVVHVQPPVGILEKMVAVRVHLDDCGLSNGPVRVIPKSHLSGRLTGIQIDAFKQNGPIVDCIVDRGGILAFYPLTLHASSQATLPAHRRVVHIEFASAKLPNGLAWYHEV